MDFDPLVRISLVLAKSQVIATKFVQRKGIQHISHSNILFPRNHFQNSNVLIEHEAIGVINAGSSLLLDVIKDDLGHSKELCQQTLLEYDLRKNILGEFTDVERIREKSRQRQHRLDSFHRNSSILQNPLPLKRFFASKQFGTLRLNGCIQIGLQVLSHLDEVPIKRGIHKPPQQVMQLREIVEPDICQSKSPSEVLPPRYIVR